MSRLLPRLRRVHLPDPAWILWLLAMLILLLTFWYTTVAGDSHDRATPLPLSLTQRSR